MLDVLFVALFQVAAGEPTAAPAPDTAPAAEPAAPAPAATPAQPQQQQRRRCRKVRTTGSMISQRVCVSESDEQQRSDHARDMVDELNRGIDTRQMGSGGFGSDAGGVSRMPRL